MKLSKGVISSVILSLFLALVGPSAILAHATDTGQGIQVSPAIVELYATRGKTYTINLRAMNVTDGSLTYNLSVKDFTASGETGAPHVIDNSNLPETASIKTWVSVDSSFTLGSHKEKNVDATVNVPINAEAGGHYGILNFSGSAPNIDTTGVGVTATTGVLFLIRVDGDIVEKADLASFFTSNSNGHQNSFFESGPINFAIRIQNIGNVHVKPTGNIEVRDMFGNVAGNISVNGATPPSNVLPKSIRRFDVKMDKPWMFGLYTANLALGYGTTGQAMTNTITFWVIPWKLVLIVLLIIAVIIYLLKRMVRSYNKKIERRVLQQHENKKNSHKQGKS
jgi:Na+-transporting methylmalonyl-CoA/oxaloacetate decarboxylase gamma subunit